MSTDTIERGKSILSQHKHLTVDETKFLQAALNADFIVCDIRLREGEYQYDLAKTIGSFQLKLHFPTVKDIAKELYGEEKANDVQFIRKVQTILKKMERRKIVTILPKKNPWELQRYALLGFKFQDTDNNVLVLATDEQIKQTQSMLDAIISKREISAAKLTSAKAKIGALILTAAVSYSLVIWELAQSAINPIVFIPAFSVATVCSLVLGKQLA